MNNPTVIDQELEVYLEMTKTGSSEQSDAILDQLMDRYNLTSDNTNGFLDGTLQKIYDAQTKADEILNPKAEQFLTFDGHVYGVRLTNCEKLNIDDEAWNPMSGCPVVIHADNIHFANEEYWNIVSCEKEPELPKPKEWQIEICRTSYAHRTIKVTAVTYEEACELACDKAGDYEFSESDADYSAQ